MITLFVKVKKKIAINLRNLFDTAIGLRVLGMAFLRLSDLKIFWGVCSQTPLETRALGAR